MKFSREAIYAQTADTTPKALACGLDKPCSMCHGAGVSLSDTTAYVHARLCQCVQTCMQCMGTAKKVHGNLSMPCKNPSPQQIIANINAACIPSRYVNASFNNFKNYSGNGKQVLTKISKWLEQFKPSHCKGVLLTGPVGVGKTYLLASLAKHFAFKGYSVRFTDFFQLLGELRAGFSEGKADASQLAPLIDVDVLIIDELGKGRNKDFDKTVLDQLVTGRYNQNKSIIASTNYHLNSHKNAAHSYNVDLDRDYGGQSDFAPDQFGALDVRVGQRIYSRLIEMCHFAELTGQDYRKTKAPEPSSMP